MQFPADPNLERFYSFVGNADGFFYVGHASALCVVHGRRILFDPIVLSRPYGDSWSFFPPQVVDPSFFEVDAVIVSHIHQDHYDPRFLRALAERTKLIVIGGRPAFLASLRGHNVRSVVVVEPETVTEIFPGILIYGVLHESNGVDSSALVFSQNFCVYHGNDNYLGRESLKKFVNVGPPIDVACLPYAYVHWYPFLLDVPPSEEAWVAAEGDRLIRLYMDDCIAATRMLRPRVVVPFGANLLLNHGGAYSPVNSSVKSPIEFFEYAQSMSPDLSSVIKPMLAGDWCRFDSLGDITISMRPSCSAKAYRESAHDFLAALTKEDHFIDWERVDLDEFLFRLNERLSLIEVPEPHFVQVEMAFKDARLNLEIDCETRSARWVKLFVDVEPYHRFKLDPMSSFAWLRGGRMEEVIGSRRFRLKRAPNVYSKSILRLTSTVF